MYFVEMKGKKRRERSVSFHSFFFVEVQKKREMELNTRNIKALQHWI
jgi:hypothetical protein